jgi:hypothetical protein
LAAAANRPHNHSTHQAYQHPPPPPPPRSSTTTGPSSAPSPSPRCGPSSPSTPPVSWHITRPSTSSVEMLSSEQGVFVELPPLSCGGIWGQSRSRWNRATVRWGKSSYSEEWCLEPETCRRDGGLGSCGHRRVNAGAGACPPPPPLCVCGGVIAGWAHRLRGGGGGSASGGSVRATGAGSAHAAWTWRQLPAMSVGRHGC